MKTYVALLRSINVGGNSKVEMPKLKKVFESLEYSDVSTYINSGNVIFSSNAKVDTLVIEKALKKQFGFDIRIVVRDMKNIQKIVKAIPLDLNNDTEQKTDVLFLWDEFDNKKSLELLCLNEVDRAIYVSGAIVWNIKRSDYGKSAMSKFVGTKLYKGMTARNVNTVRRLGGRVIIQ